MPATDVAVLDPGEVAGAFGVLPTLAPVAAELLRLADDERASLEDIARVIGRDPALAGQLLRVANSAMFGMGGRTTSLARAASILGLRTVKLLSLSFSVVTRPDPADEGATLVWRHTLVTSAVARAISARRTPRLADECFIAGLLGNLGRLALAEHPAYAEAAQGSPAWLDTAEELAAVGCTSDEVTARILDNWGLPPVLGEAIRNRSEPDRAEGVAAVVAAVLGVANAAARLVVASPEHAGHALEHYRHTAGLHLALTAKEADALLVDAAPALEEIAAMFRSENPHDVPLDVLLLRAKDGLARLSLATLAALSQEQHRTEQLESENRRLAAEAATDTLTALPNRRAYETFIERAVGARARRQASGALGLLMIDLDHFKSINDTYGHRVGDSVLRLIGAMLALHTRRDEFTARIGGEEFAVVIPTTDAEEIALAAERFRRAIGMEPLDTPAGPLRITASVGAAWLDDTRAAGRQAPVRRGGRRPARGEAGRPELHRDGARRLTARGIDHVPRRSHPGTPAPGRRVDAVARRRAHVRVCAMPGAARRAVALARASHLAPTVAVTVFAGAYALGIGAGAGRAGQVALAVLAGQLSIGWSNDWIDAERDRAVGRSDKPVVSGGVAAAQVRAAALVAAAACVLLSFLLGPAAGAVHVLAVASAWAYNAWLKATAWSWVPYALSFGLLPSVATLALHGRLATATTTVAAALLGVGAHLANVLPDLDDDAATGVVGLPHRLGRRRATAASVAVLVGATAIVALSTPGGITGTGLAALVAAAGLGTSAAWVASRRPASRYPFLAAMGVAGVTVAVLVAVG